MYKEAQARCLKAEHALHTLERARVSLLERKAKASKVVADIAESIKQNEESVKAAQDDHDESHQALRTLGLPTALSPKKAKGEKPKGGVQLWNLMQQFVDALSSQEEIDQSM